MKQPDNKIHIMLCMCSHRLIDVASLMSMDSLITNVPQGFRLTKVIGLEASITKSRSFWTTVFYKNPDYDVLAFVDDDMVFNPADFWKICRTAYDKKCVVGAIYMKREHPPTAIVKVAGNKICFDGTIQEVDGLGAGFLAIHRDVVEGVVKNAELVGCGKVYQGEDFPVYYPTFAELVIIEHDVVIGDDYPDLSDPCWQVTVKINERRVWLGEDYSFCYLAKKAGFTILADTSLFVEHVGQYKYSAKDLKLFENKDV